MVGTEESATMKIEIGSKVNSSDGQNIGSVDRLIVDPTTSEVRAAVIRKGVFLPRDIEVPISSLTGSPDGELAVDISADEVKNLPEFAEAMYILPPPQYQLPDGFTAGSLYWPAGTMLGSPQNIPATTMAADRSMDSAIQDAARAGESTQEFDDAVIGKGSTVSGRDGETIGKVAELAFDPKTGALSGLVVRSGLLVHNDRHIASSLIDTVEEGLITLKVDADQLTT
jgi:sporulation protein YlmC with PRC-barrel domain